MIDLSSKAKRAYTTQWIIGAGESTKSIIKNGVIALDGDRITYAGTLAEYAGAENEELTKLPDSVIFPGLINCHTHTNAPRDIRPEFKSGLMVDWARASLGNRSLRSESEQFSDIRNSLERLQETATVAIGEISNDFVSLKPIINSGLICRYFCERLGFQSSRAPEIYSELKSAIAEHEKSISILPLKNGQISPISFHLAPHAPYSTSPELIRSLTDSKSLSSIHLAENREECELLQTGEGAWRDYLRDIGRDDPDWKTPVLSPAEYLDSLGALHENMLLVHLTKITRDEIKLIEERKARVALCPRSNSFIDVGVAPLSELLDSQIPIGIGTDSYSSNDDLNLFAELRELRRSHPSVSSEQIWNLATGGGAKALGYDDMLGELRAGLAPGVFAAEISDALDIVSPAELLERLIAEGDQNLTRLSLARI